MADHSVSGEMLSRVRGAWFGVFVGDALGTTLEFQPKPSSRAAIRHWHDEITGGGPFGLEPGDWTDDGAMTLCLANALSGDAPPRMDVGRQLEYYLRWQDAGWCSSNGRCFDIGNQTAQALAHFDATASSVAPESAQGQGNGALMRAVPVPIWLLPWHLQAHQAEVPPHVAAVDASSTDRFAAAYEDMVQGDPSLAARAALYARACAATHNNPVCIAAAVVYSELVLNALGGHSRQQLIARGTEVVSRARKRFPEFGQVLQALTGDMPWERLTPTGWVLHSLAIACWALRSYDSFGQGMTEVVNLRGDADTNGAIYGGLAGAHFGIDAIPDKWSGRLKHQDRLSDTLDALLAGASRHLPTEFRFTAGS